MSGGFTPSLVTRSDAVTAEAAFLASEHMAVKRVGVTLDAATVPANEKGQKVLRAGTFCAKITATGKYGPYPGARSESQTLTIGGAGLVSYTLTFGGVTTASLLAAATAAQVQAALEALPNIHAGDVSVSGTPATAFTVAFGGEWGGKDVPALTTTPTGGTGTVTVATSVAGGAAASDGREAPDDNTSGYLLESVNLQYGDVVTGLLVHGSVLSARVTPTPDATTKAAVKGRITYQ